MNKYAKIFKKLRVFRDLYTELLQKHKPYYAARLQDITDENGKVEDDDDISHSKLTATSGRSSRCSSVDLA